MAQPATKPMMAGAVCFARSRAFATASGFRPASISTMSIISRVTLLVITAVAGAPFRQIWTRAFWTAIAATPSIAATIVMAEGGSGRGPAATQAARKPASSRSCSSNSGCNVARPRASNRAASHRVRPTTSMKTGTDSIGASRMLPPATAWAARTTRLPVMCAVNSPSPRKPMTSVAPAIMPSTKGSSLPSELPAEGADSRTIEASSDNDTTLAIDSEAARSKAAHPGDAAGDGISLLAAARRALRNSGNRRGHR